MPNQQKPKNQKSPALGKGLNSLLGIESPEGLESKWKDRGPGLMQIAVSDIQINPKQPRKFFKKSELDNLASSIEQDGLLQPLVVSSTDHQGKYILIAGERRWRASQLAGLNTVPAIVKQVANDDLLRLALVENIQRSDLNPIEEAEAYLALINDHGLTQEECAHRVGKERATIANFLRLLSLPVTIQNDLIESKLSIGHAKALASLDNQKMISRARDIIVKKALNVRQTEQLCRKLKKNKEPEVSGATAVSPDLDYLVETLRNQLKTKVKMTGSGARGKIEISYFSPAELERIISLIGDTSF